MKSAQFDFEWAVSLVSYFGMHDFLYCAAFTLALKTALLRYLRFTSPVKAIQLLYDKEAASQ